MSDDSIKNADAPIEAVAPKPKKKRSKRKPVLPPDQWQLVLDIAEQLQERQRERIASIIKNAGLEFVQTLLQETLAIEAQGGMPTLDGSRRRTPGGVFFFLAKQKLPPDLRQTVFPVMTWQEKRARDKRKKQQRQGKQPTPSRHEPERPSFDWQGRHNILSVLLEAPGTASTAKVTLIGRPELYELFTDLAFITLTHPPRLNSLPRGVPRPENGLEATYSVLIGLKQWAKVEAALLADESDVLVIEGLYAFNEQLGGMAVYATNATTRNLQIQQRQQSSEN